MEYPKVSVLIPTLNSSSVLEDCLKSIEIQDFPKNMLEIIIADGGSTDATLEIAKKHGGIIVSNPLRTAESGKMSALRIASGEFVALIDSDNILPNSSWLTRMLDPLRKEPAAVGSEPWEYVWRKEDGFISRYCALMGMNDPFVYFLGNYDRLNTLSGKWTETRHSEQDKGDYILATFDQRGIPTIGANGTIFRTKFLRENAHGNYLFDIDILSKYLHEKGRVDFVKVKEGIVHTFCESNIGKFARKQQRRVLDYLYHNSVGDRDYSWFALDIFGPHPFKTLKFIFYCLLIVPLFLQAFSGYLKKPDLAWFFHPLACEITLLIYGWGRTTSLFRKSEISRANWSQ